MGAPHAWDSSVGRDAIPGGGEEVGREGGREGGRGLGALNSIRGEREAGAVAHGRSSGSPVTGGLRPHLMAMGHLDSKQKNTKTSRKHHP